MAGKNLQTCMMMIVAAALAACGGGSSLECGEGTHEEGGVCIPDSTITCGTGTHEDNGRCVPDSQRECGDGTIFDESTGSCVPSYDTICGEGTVLNSAAGTCLPDYDLLCPDGMIFDEALQDCVPATMDYEEAPENNDPLTAGSPLQITLPSEGTTITIGGSIGEPTEVTTTSGEVILYPDNDVVEFHATKGQVLRIEGTSLGNLPSVAFAIAPSDLYSDAPVSMSPVRYGVAGDSRNPVRFVRVLEEADYWLFITDKDNLMGLSSTGGDGMQYVIALSTLATPADEAATLGTAFTDDILDEPALTAVSGAASDMLVFLNVDPPEVTAMTRRYLFLLDETDSIVTVLSDTLALDLFSGRTVILPMSPVRMILRQTGMKLFLDYDMDTGAEASFTVSASQVPVEDAGTISETSAPVVRTDETLDTSDYGVSAYSFTVSAPDGALVRFSMDDYTAGFEPYILIKDLSYQNIASLDVAWEGITEKTAYVPGGTGYIEVGSIYGDAGTMTYSFTLSVVDTVAEVLDETEPNDGMSGAQAVDLATMPVKVSATISPSDIPDFYSFTPPAAGPYTFFAYSAGADLSLSLYDAAGTNLWQADAFWSPGEEILAYALEASTTYYVEVVLWTSGTFDYDLVVGEI